MKRSIALFLLFISSFPQSGFGYSQDPRSCADPKTQYPSDPPCVAPSPFLVAQLDRSPNGDRVSDLGSFTANSDREASKKCTAKGGNIVVKNFGNSYTCHYYQGLRR